MFWNTFNMFFPIKFFCLCINTFSFHYIFSSQRSEGTTKRKSHGHDVVKNNQRMMLGLLLKNDKNKEYSADESVKDGGVNRVNAPLIIVLLDNILVLL